jgi:SSS family solute:Na+ symporter
MLTAETHQKARRSLLTAAFMDIPIAAAFTFIGILLYAYYQQDPTFKPAANSDVFGSYILNVMPVGIRGLVLAGVFATAMGSFSAALNALATSATNDWYIRLRRGRSEEHYVNAARWLTVVFAALMVLVAVAFAYAKVKDPSTRIIPVVLGIASYILGPMLGVFLLGMLTKRRGSDVGNIIALTCGLLATTLLGGLHLDVLNYFGQLVGHTTPFAQPGWLPKISFTWFAMIGASVVFAVGILFRTPETVMEEAKRVEENAESGDDRPMEMRNTEQQTAINHGEHGGTAISAGN